MARDTVSSLLRFRLHCFVVGLEVQTRWDTHSVPRGNRRSTTSPQTKHPTHFPHITGDGTFQAYQLPSIPDNAGWGCSGQRLCNSFKDMWVYRTQWQLPKDFRCDHCKLQWTWTTGHSCWPPCDAGNPMPQCPNTQQFGTCGEPGVAYPEEFVNCADIKVSDTARIDAATNLPPWNGAVALKTGLWGAIRPSVIHERDPPPSTSEPRLDKSTSSPKTDNKTHLLPALKLPPKRLHY